MRAVSVGAGLLTVNVCPADVPPPGAELLTVTDPAPVRLRCVIVMLAVICVALSTVVVLTVMPEPKLTEVTLPKFVPVRIDIAGSEARFPALGLMAVSVGAALLLTTRRWSE